MATRNKQSRKGANTKAIRGVVGGGGPKVRPSRAAPPEPYIGTYPRQAVEVCRHVWKHPLALESNYARQYRVEVAFAASMGWITVIHPDGHSYDRAWHITAAGLIAIKEN